MVSAGQVQAAREGMVVVWCRRATRLPSRACTHQSPSATWAATSIASGRSTSLEASLSDVSSSGSSRSSSSTEEPAAESFDVLEAVRQVVSADRSSASPGTMSTSSPPPLIKDIETTTLYTKVGEDRIEALQRTASFLVPSTNSDPLKAAAIQRMGGRAVDIRTYRVVYKLKRRLETKEKDEQQA